MVQIQWEADVLKLMITIKETNSIQQISLLVFASRELTLSNSGKVKRQIKEEHELTLFA